MMEMISIIVGWFALACSSLSASEESSEKPLTYFGAFKWISKLGLSVALSYTFSFSVVLVGLFLYTISKNSAQRAAAGFIPTFMSSVIGVSISPLVIMNIPASRYLGMLDKLEKVIQKENSEEEGEFERIRISAAATDTPSAEELRGLVCAVLRNGLCEGAVLASLAMLAFLSSGPFLVAIGEDPEIGEDVEEFFKFYCWGVPFLVLRIIFEQMMLAFRRTTPAMIIGLTNLVFCSLLAYVLGFGILGWSGLGSVGIALGYVFEAFLTALSYGLYLKISEVFKDFAFINLCQNVKGTFKLFIEMLKLGLIKVFITSNQMLTLIIASLYAGHLGNEEESAWGAGLTYMSFTLILIYAFGAMCSQELSRFMGAEKYIDASRVAVLGLFAAFLYGMLIPIFFALFPQTLASLLSLDEATTSMLPNLLPLVSGGIFFDIGRFTLMTELRALNRNRFIAMVSFVVMLLSVGLMSFLGFYMPMGINGIALGYGLGSAFGVLTLLRPWFIEIQPHHMREVRSPRREEVKNTSTVSNCCSALFSCVKEYFYQKEEKAEETHLLSMGING